MLGKLALTSLSIASAELYCPGQADFGFDGGVAWNGEGGWDITGGGGVHGKQTFNLLGGYIEFDMDLSQAKSGVNNNFYTVSPNADIFSATNECDIQGQDKPSCMEMDIIENNGKCVAQSTWHTWPNHDGGCDRGGCWGQMCLSNDVLHVRGDFSVDGWMTISINGAPVDVNNPSPSQNSVAYVESIMKADGAQIQSSQWVGWVPDGCGCDTGSGDLGASIFKIKNIRVSGTVLQNLNDNLPPVCSAPAPGPATPAPTGGGGGGSKALYCPGKETFGFDGGAKWTGDANGAGWTIKGEGGVHTGTTWNVLDGYIEFDMDVSKAQPGVNNNLYTTSPEPSYLAPINDCDIQGEGKPSCMEMDIIENNGKCLAQTTWHTWPNHDGDCDRGGCWGQMCLPSDHLHIKAYFGVDGYMTVTINGATVEVTNPRPSSNSQSYVMSQLKSVGAQIQSSQWVGWVPEGQCGCSSGGDLSQSEFSVSGLKVYGSVVQGAEPTQCASASFKGSANGFKGGSPLPVAALEVPQHQQRKIAKKRLRVRKVSADGGDAASLLQSPEEYEEYEEYEDDEAVAQDEL